MYWICIVKDHEAGTLTISGTNKVKRVVDGQKADLLNIELVNIFEVEDLRIDLANKKVYQLINEANNAEYYYDQVKDQRR